MVNDTQLYKIYYPLLLAAILTAVCGWFMPTAFSKIEANFGDYVWRVIGDSSHLEQRVVVIDIDEESMARYGAWPWPREKVAELAVKAKQSGVGMLVYDMVFPQGKSGDVDLSAGLRQVPSVLAQILAIQATSSTQMGVLKTGHPSQQCADVFPVAVAVIANNAQLTSAASSAGHITPNIDSDGVIRSVPSLICYNEHSYPALALAAVSEGFGGAAIFELIDNDSWWDSAYEVQAQDFPAELSVPVDSAGNIQLPWWLSRESIISISAADLMEGRVANNVLQGKWAIIGSTAFGTGDSIVTPQGAIADGLEVHVQLISALLDSRVPFTPKIATVLQLILIVFMAFILKISVSVAGGRVVYMPLIAGLLLSCVGMVTHVLLLLYMNMLMPWIYGVMFSMLSSLLIALSGYAISRKKGEVLYKNLSSYLPSHAAKWIATQQPVDVLDARHEQVLVLHADLRNFSAWCDHLPAQQAGAVLHAFYTLTSSVIQKMGGDVEEFVGDSVTAIWRGDFSADRVMLAAREIVLEGEKLLGNETHNDKVPPLAIGVGVEYGDILAGAFGASQRRTYTVIGKAVTTAMRLQDLTADIGVPILVGQAAAELWGQGDERRLESLGDFLLQGMSQPINVYALIDAPSIN